MPTVLDKGWQDWTDKFLALPQKQMHQKKAEIFFGCLQREMEGHDLPEAGRNSFSFKVGQAHAKSLGLSIQPWTLMFLTTLVESPACLVMYVHALRRWQQLNYGQDLNFMALAKAFPMGYPAKDQMYVLWDDQKLSPEDRPNQLTDNYLDLVTDVNKEPQHAGDNQTS